MSDVKKIVLDPEPVEESAEAVQYDFGKYLVPGEDKSTAPAFEPGRSQGTGKCDGVIYLVGRKNPQTSAMELPDRFKDALRYLRGQTLEWCALNVERVGRCKPDIWPILVQPHNRVALNEIESECQATSQGFSCMFKLTPRALEATRPENVKHWHVVKAAEGVWGVIWVD
jgi:hypothetical protein